MCLRRMAQAKGYTPNRRIVALHFIAVRKVCRKPIGFALMPHKPEPPLVLQRRNSDMLLKNLSERALV